MRHAGLTHAEPFTDAQITRAAGFSGEQAKEAVADSDFDFLIPRMRAAFKVVDEDLKQLINEFWPHMNFTGMEPEV